MNCDVNISIQLKDPHEPRCFIEKSEDDVVIFLENFLLYL